MRRGRRRRWVGLGVLLTFLAALFASPASAQTSSWEFEPREFDFGSVLLNSHPSHSFGLTNTGETPIAAGSWRLRWYSLESGLYHVVSNGCHGLVLQPQASCPVVLSFNPTTLVSTEAEFEIEPGDSTGVPNAVVYLDGIGAEPVFAVKPEQLTFGPVEAGSGSSPPQIVTIENRGSFGLTIGSIATTDLSGALQVPSPFQVGGGSCQGGIVVPPSGSCTVAVAIAPTESGTFHSRLAIADNAPGSPHLIDLLGIGMPASHPAKPRRSKSANGHRGSSLRITHHPSRLSAKHTAMFSFSISPPGARTECELDRLGFEPCSSPNRYSGLSSGAHRFLVRSRGSSRSASSAKARFQWRIRDRNG
jgi:hypothetical protein